MHLSPPSRQPRGCAMPGNTAPRWAMALAFSLWLGACTPGPAEPPTAPTPGDRPDLTMPRTPSTDSSVPAAAAVFSAPVAAATAAATAPGPAASAPQARSNTSMTPAQESGSMPMPGQANDHSVPVTPPRPAASR